MCCTPGMRHASSWVYLTSMSRLSWRSLRSRWFSSRRCSSARGRRAAEGSGEPSLRVSMRLRSSCSCCCCASNSVRRHRLSSSMRGSTALFCSSCSIREPRRASFWRSAAPRLRSSCRTRSSSAFVRAASSTCVSSIAFCWPSISICSRSAYGAPTRGPPPAEQPGDSSLLCAGLWSRLDTGLPDELLIGLLVGLWSRLRPAGQRARPLPHEGFAACCAPASGGERRRAGREPALMLQDCPRDRGLAGASPACCGMHAADATFTGTG
mmetsp:Transcript_53170/g.149831  ORF Transcript_53170/g.149831 Transcript_53170/m.149831 type:complete len:267 (-) Transcript_53170:4-804(-)